MTLTVVGIGNRNARDDAVGLVLVETLPIIPSRSNITLLPWENADALTLAHDLLALPGPVLIVDCADMGLAPGEWRCFSLEEGGIQQHHGTVSTHGLGMAEAMAMARGLGYDHPIHLFGIQPFDLSPHPTLSPSMTQRLPVLLEALAATVDRHNTPPAIPTPWVADQVVPLAKPMHRSILAMGTETKNSPALGLPSAITLFKPLGDLTDPTARTLLEQSARELLEHPDPIPRAIAVDLHPDMASSVLGIRLAREYALPIMTIQHHHAHAAACMAEHHLEESLALVCDGMGWGTDGNLWGAELLHVKGSHCVRLGTFAPAPLPGGDAAVRHPLRQLLARWVIAGVEPTERWCGRVGITATEAAVWTHQCHHGLHTPSSHAAGRLFDAFAALLGIAPPTIAFEGEPAIRLEAHARHCSESLHARHHLPFTLKRQGSMRVVDWNPLFRQFSPDREWSPDETILWAYSFHQAVATALVRLVTHAMEQTGLNRVVLGGGVFMNTLLKEHFFSMMEDRACQIYYPQRLPPGDAAIALGQAWIAGRRV
ncbi:MAG: hydrogenase maturation protease [Magnetococcales bacterium]|nr:hydrogenase maturation protease [Magnetococcales bacterium]MBF0151386.1 hydrogenase maturation protease [Magnetococcales bacterium]MBF0174352.1 hydrogenase maturation protease [Magnetococcales bacterium]